MAIKSVTKVFNERLVRDGSGIKLNTNYRVEFTEIGNDVGDCIGATDPNTSLAVPAAGATRTVTIEDGVSVDMVLTSFEPNQVSPLVFNILCTYEVEPPEGSISTPNANGNWDLNFSIRSAQVVVDTGFDKDGDAIVNSAGEPFQGVKTVGYDREITINFKTLTPPIAAAEALLGYINSSSCAFTINGITESFDAKVLKLTDCDFSTSTLADQTYWNCSLKFLARPDTWVTTLIDQGTYYYDSGGKQQPFAETIMRGQGLLDGAGGQQPTNFDPEAIDYWLDQQGDFTALLAGL